MGKDGFVNNVAPVWLSPVAVFTTCQRTYIPFPLEVVKLAVSSYYLCDAVIETIGTRTEPFALFRVEILREVNV